MLLSQCRVKKMNRMALPSIFYSWKYVKLRYASGKRHGVGGNVHVRQHVNFMGLPVWVQNSEHVNFTGLPVKRLISMDIAS
jgi:hypothetical protein